MPLQNRVTPFSTIEATSERGMFMGNRGCLHNDQQQLVSQRWRVKRWIICVLEFKERKRQVMLPHRYTELFFLDEAVALAAGHRPCAECRRDDFRKFIGLWSAQTGLPADADALDAALHKERVISLNTGYYPTERLDTLPTGTFIRLATLPYLAWLVYNGYLYAWSHSGYTEKIAIQPDLQVDVITPPATVNVLRAGYSPVFHSSLGTH